MAIEKFSDIASRIGKISFDSFPVEMLSEMHDKLVGNRETIREQALGIESRMRASIEQLDGFAIDELKADLRRLKRENSDNEDTLRKVWNALQERKLREKQIKIFGSTYRYLLKETFVFLLILVVLGLLFFVIAHDNLAPATYRRLFFADAACCLVFLFNFFFELKLAQSKSWYWRTHWIDFVTSIPVPDFLLLRYGRAFRLLRLVRLFRLARALRILRILLFFWRGMDQLDHVLDVKLMKRSFMYGAAVLIVGGLAIYLAENRDAGVESLGQAIWWSFTTVVTGGFGDIHNPQTFTGRMLTVGLVIIGMIVVGVFTATLTSIMVDEADDKEFTMVRNLVDERFEELKKMIEAQNERDGGKG